MTVLRGFVPGLLLATLCVSALSATTPDCGALCGRWLYDEAASDPVEAKLDAVLAGYKEPKIINEPDSPMGPTIDRPQRSEVRTRILAALAPPRTLQFTLAGADVLIGADDRPARRLSPGVPHSRVDEDGTARIRATLQPGKLTVVDRYDSRYETVETYAVEKKGGAGSLIVTLDIRRPGLKALKLRRVYRPG